MDLRSSQWVRMLRPWALAVPTGLGLGLVAAPAWAGSVSIEVQPGGKAETTIVIKAGAGGGSATVTTRDGGIGDRDPRPGHIKVEPGIAQGDIKTVDIKAVGPAASAPAAAASAPPPAASAASAATTSRMVFGDAGLLSFEPIDLPRLMSTDASRILLSVIDVPTFLAATDPPPEPGDSLLALGGLVAGHQGLTLYDATALYGGIDSFFDVFVDLELVDLNLLPRWQGEVWVDSLIGFRVVTEPGALGLLGLAGLAWAALAARRRQRGVSPA